MIDELLKNVPAHEVIAAVRTPERAQGLQMPGVTLPTADYNQPETLRSAVVDVVRPRRLRDD